jgi:hypothetical protein
MERCSITTTPTSRNREDNGLAPRSACAARGATSKALGPGSRRSAQIDKYESNIEIDDYRFLLWAQSRFSSYRRCYVFLEIIDKPLCCGRSLLIDGASTFKSVRQKWEDFETFRERASLVSWIRQGGGLSHKRSKCKSTTPPDLRTRPRYWPVCLQPPRSLPAHGTSEPSLPLAQQSTGVPFHPEG